MANVSSEPRLFIRAIFVYHIFILLQGFDVDGRENLQEWLSKRLYLCECTAALSILRTGKSAIKFNKPQITSLYLNVTPMVDACGLLLIKASLRILHGSVDFQLLY